MTFISGIGNTLLVQLKRINGDETVRRGNILLGKLEGNNPACSIKDRPVPLLVYHAI